jgi:excisionase family DNA binding protein
MTAKLLTTREAASAVGIGRVTLQRWIRARKIRAPKARLRGGIGVRLWGAADVERLRLAKEKIYRRGRGRKRVSK